MDLKEGMLKTLIRTKVSSVVSYFFLFSVFLFLTGLTTYQFSTLNRSIRDFYVPAIPIHHLKIKEVPTPVYTPIRSLGINAITAYTPSVDETDSDPCHTASGLEICKTKRTIIANNCLKFGTMVMIQGKYYTVNDRMNSRYGCDMYDILFYTKDEAFKFGTRKLEVVLVEG